ncbi:type I methionyl aminopeptidase [Actinomycetospora corticicola]|uniref:Methionine aminopeptidase n=1 Tax=Actinomycetospora corticicola TaxID=663602 RepID=A0A7Y9DY57_9PSEU|nr:type I methionyl aminopeptidase [Actinomycetospora corticicola]NYD37714.1 methionyl aminopeptidase [Actinomycetospora corticicola]
MTAGLGRVAGRLSGGRIGSEIQLKSRGEIEAMRAAGLVVAEALSRVTAAATVGVSTKDLDELAETTIREAGAVPSFLGYHGFPGSICASVNAEVVHGIPAATTVLADGDLLSVDCGAILEGWHGDAAVTLQIGTARPGDTALSAACRASMWAGIAEVRPGNRLGDVSHAVEHEVGRHHRPDGGPFGIVADYGGHGIGTEMHMEPFLPNVGRPGTGLRLREGMVLAIEPMLTAGDPETDELDDEWTVVTLDGGRAAHWEHTVAVTDHGPWVLTAAAETERSGARPDGTDG